MRWMKVGHVIQKEVSQKKQHQNSIYMEFRKTVMTTLYARQQKRHKCKEQILDYVGEGEDGTI